jgi:hypothetical protein
MVSLNGAAFWHSIHQSKYHWIHSIRIFPLNTHQSLETLFLNDNEMDTITMTTQNPFPKLKYLGLERNKINDWSSLDALDSFTLNHLRCKENPIFKGILIHIFNLDASNNNQFIDLGKEVESAHIVGRISSITTVNGNTVLHFFFFLMNHNHICLFFHLF